MSKELVSRKKAVRHGAGRLSSRGFESAVVYINGRLVNARSRHLKKGPKTGRDEIVVNDGTVQVTIDIEKLQGNDLIGALKHLNLRDIIIGKAQEAKTEIDQVEQSQLDLYRPKVLERVAHRFTTKAKAEEWFENGRIPGFGEKTPKQMVENGHAGRVIEAINAIEAGVYS